MAGYFNSKLTFCKLKVFLPGLLQKKSELQQLNYLQKVQISQWIQKYNYFSVKKKGYIWRCYSKKTQEEPTNMITAQDAVNSDKKKLVLGDWVKISFKTRTGEIFESPVRINQSVMDAALENDIAMHGNCEGKLCCCTCHVYVDEAYTKFIPEISEEEEDMLDITPLRESNSRLSCQIIVTKELNGAVFNLPYEEEKFDYGV